MEILYGKEHTYQALWRHKMAALSLCAGHTHVECKHKIFLMDLRKILKINKNVLYYQQTKSFLFYDPYHIQIKI